MRNEVDLWKDEQYLKDKEAREAKETKTQEREEADTVAEEAQVARDRTTQRLKDLDLDREAADTDRIIRMEVHCENTATEENTATNTTKKRSRAPQ